MPGIKGVGYERHFNLLVGDIGPEDAAFFGPEVGLQPDEDFRLQPQRSRRRLLRTFGALALAVIALAALGSLGTQINRVTVLTWGGHPVRRAYVAYGFQERDFN